MAFFNHQKVILEKLQTHSNYAIFAEQGCGKTYPMLQHISNLLLTGEISNALIVAPLSATGAWYRDMKMFNSYKRKLIEDNVTIVNYEKISTRSKEYLESSWDCIVLDESHSIAYRTSNRTKVFVGYNAGKTKIKGLNTKAKYRYIMTGTPISNGHLEQYYTQMEFLQPGILGTYNEFRMRYLIERQIPGTFSTFVVGYRNKEELLSIIGSKSYRIKKKECLDLPEKLEDIVISCPLVEKLKYKQAKEMFIEELDMTIANPLSQVTKLRQIASGHVKDEYGDVHVLKESKTKMLEELIDSIGDEKFCIYANYTKSIDVIEQLIIKKKINYIILDGRQKDKLIWRKFQQDDSIQCIICQYKSANSGIDLFASSHMIFYEPDLSTTIIEQTKDRIHRIGQHNPCSYYWLLTEGTIDYDIYERLKKGQDFNEECMLAIARQR